MGKQYRSQEFIDNIAKKINEIRLEKGIVQEDIVDRTGFTQKQVWSLLNGKSNPTVSSIEAIAKALEVHPKVFLEFDFDIPKNHSLRKDRKKKS
ncbi:helix-turn-helix domain-containing protein [Mucilaginibacter sp. X4EP1]|uniref:helix-turn-helix domain-containing protein n=1 Tax=Mucilaginibacter sp. X4EP1 TaxID=2723092 RepID=UPI002168E598|nr:helix-turn-helix transcriptional regulator [Mucilaginibacter sp. X4EP1]MCS3811507.1 transcriptional regulator with XRE-family HTH domain [Mucilaginibacter sp. X4EP1]